jgi:hypothetical protein
MRWVNPQHPQTLNIGVILLYIDAVFLVIGGSIASGLGLLLAIGSVAAAAGIANDKRVAWYAGVAISAIVPILLLLSLRNNGFDTLFDTGFLLGAVFPIAQFAALIHPMSQSHVKAWFE